MKKLLILLLLSGLTGCTETKEDNDKDNLEPYVPVIGDVVEVNTYVENSLRQYDNYQIAYLEENVLAVMVGEYFYIIDGIKEAIVRHDEFLYTTNMLDIRPIGFNLETGTLVYFRLNSVYKYDTNTEIRTSLFNAQDGFVANETGGVAFGLQNINVFNSQGEVLLQLSAEEMKAIDKETAVFYTKDNDVCTTYIYRGSVLMQTINDSPCSLAEYPKDLEYDNAIVPSNAIRPIQLDENTYILFFAESDGHQGYLYKVDSDESIEIPGMKGSGTLVYVKDGLIMYQTQNVYLFNRTEIKGSVEFKVFDFEGNHLDTLTGLSLYNNAVFENSDGYLVMIKDFGIPNYYIGSE